ncbi:MAG: SDR family NAD(P)-dependent oxidoreductase [Mycobacteriaceae bacterium]|nr:SDR family NAD(P)-dependent oxidoreductase [Mycobacteriaceae bacterium]
MPPRVAVVTGASSGIGHATAVALAERGYTVIGTSRDPERIPESLRHPGIRFHALDLTDADSIAAFAAGLDAAGAAAVDVLVNNAGESQTGPLEELPSDAVERLFQLNVFGAVRLSQLVLPGMRERRYGRIVMVGSMLGSFPLAYRSSYVASKAAVRGFAEAARFEVSPYGVWITTVEPGSVNTSISERRTKYCAPDSDYFARFEATIAALDRKESNGITAERVAAAVVAAIEAKRPKPLYAVGSKAPLVFALKRLLPRTAMEKITAAAFGLSATR